MRVFAVSLLFLCGLASSSLAESHDCAFPSLVVTDGRIVSSQFEGSVSGFSPTYWYSFYAQAGHSYAVEVVPTTDNENVSNAIHFMNFAIWGPGDIAGLQQGGCRGTSTLSWTSTQKYTPTIAKDSNGTGQRLSLIQPSAGLDIFSITNTQAAGAYSYRVTDTTLFNPRWSTYSGFDTQWGFTNMSDMTITGTLSIYDANNRLIKSVQVTIPGGGQIFRLSNSSDINLPRNNAGSAMFAYNGPPNAILGDAYFLNGDASVIVYAKFESRYSK